MTYTRLGEPTIVQETLSGTLLGEVIVLTGVNYTYLARGKSAIYSLDNFELELSSDETQLVGQAILKNGKRSISFKRVETP